MERGTGLVIVRRGRAFEGEDAALEFFLDPKSLMTDLVGSLEGWSRAGTSVGCSVSLRVAGRSAPFFLPPGAIVQRSLQGSQLIT